MTAALDHAGANWSFGDWVDLLGGHFFTADRAGTPVTYFVDDEILARLSGLPPEHAAQSLVRAITDLFGDLSTREASARVAQATGAWERSGSEGFIRCLPVLALAVLAGTRMAADGRIQKNNYYKRYRALIGMTGGGQPPGYRYMPYLWRTYRRWLDETLEGAQGVSTVREHPFYTYIGTALSQALFRASDRHELTYFLDSLGVAVTEGISGPRLVALLRAWAEWRGRFSVGARLLIRDPAYAEQLELLIREAARRWDGAVLDELGRRESRVLLHWNVEDGEGMTTLAERPDGFPESVTVGFGARQRVINELPGTRFYREAPVAVDSGLLAEGCRIRSGPYSFRLPRSAVHLLAENHDVPGWSSARRFSWGRPHILVADAKSARDLKPLLDRGAQSGFSGPRMYPALPDGWLAFRTVIPQPEATQAWKASPLGQLLPIETQRASLANGLRLSRARVYLIGGEPDLICPVDNFEIDGLPVDAVPGSVIKLRGRGLAPGRHQIAIGGQVLRFALSHGSAKIAEATDPVRLQVAPGYSLMGAEAPEDWSRERWTVPLRPRRRTWAIGARPGQVLSLERLPQVTRTTGIVWTPEAEAELPFEPVWLIDIDPRGRKSAKLLNDRQPEPLLSTAGAPERNWANVFVAPCPGAPELWKRYEHAARELLGNHGTG